MCCRVQVQFQNNITIAWSYYYVAVDDETSASSESVFF